VSRENGKAPFCQEGLWKAVAIVSVWENGRLDRGWRGGWRKAAERLENSLAAGSL